jgi:glyoxylase I family protein
MEKVTGIGGIFFRSKDHKALAEWYEKHLGVNQTPTSAEGEPWRQEAGATVFGPFKEDTDYFDKSKQWMINFRVRDIDAMVAQLRRAAIEVKDPEAYPGIGRFARLHDPEANAIELWEPEPS